MKTTGPRKGKESEKNVIIKAMTASVKKVDRKVSFFPGRDHSFTEY